MCSLLQCWRHDTTTFVVSGNDCNVWSVKSKVQPREQCVHCHCHGVARACDLGHQAYEVLARACPKDTSIFSTSRTTSETSATLTSVAAQRHHRLQGVRGLCCQIARSCQSKVRCSQLLLFLLSGELLFFFRCGELVTFFSVQRGGALSSAVWRITKKQSTTSTLERKTMRVCNFFCLRSGDTCGFALCTPEVTSMLRRSWTILSTPRSHGKDVPGRVGVPCSRCRPQEGHWDQSYSGARTGGGSQVVPWTVFM